MQMLIAGVLLGAIALSTQVRAQAPRTLGFGSRAGMEVTITSGRGIDTSNAIIVGRITESNAMSYCREYAGTPTQSCVRNYLNEYHLRPFIQANCATGRFTTFFGGNLQFVGAHSKTDEELSFSEPDYDIIDLAQGETLNGSSASGYSYDLEQFRALCPSKVGASQPRPVP